MKTSIKRTSSWSLLIAECSPPPTFKGGGRASSPSFSNPTEAVKHSKINPKQSTGSLGNASLSPSLFKKNRKSSIIYSLCLTNPSTISSAYFPRSGIKKFNYNLSPKPLGHAHIESIRTQPSFPPGQFEITRRWKCSNYNLTSGNLSHSEFSRFRETNFRFGKSFFRPSFNRHRSIIFSSILFTSLPIQPANQKSKFKNIRSFISKGMVDSRIHPSQNKPCRASPNNRTDLSLSYQLCDTQRDKRNIFFTQPTTITQIESTPLVRQISMIGPPGQLPRVVGMELCVHNSRPGPEFNKQPKKT